MKIRVYLYIVLNVAVSSATFFFETHRDRGHIGFGTYRDRGHIDF
jgi:hypothetical protein